MGLSSRYYLFAEDGVHRIAKRVVEGLVQGIDALPNYNRVPTLNAAEEN